MRNCPNCNRQPHIFEDKDKKMDYWCENCQIPLRHHQLIENPILNKSLSQNAIDEAYQKGIKIGYHEGYKKSLDDCEFAIKLMMEPYMNDNYLKGMQTALDEIENLLFKQIAKNSENHHHGDE